MGTLIAWHYPTDLFAKLADHTYVTCGNGGARWKCWGGDTGGNALRQGTGSTKRADAIAEPDERGGITCYLINGVCHQAANRILLPAKITVRGAKGYYVSEAMYGTYGRPRGFLGTCRAPFHQHPGVSGELTACETDVTDLSDDESESALNVLDMPDESNEFRKYLSRVTSLYEETDVDSLQADSDQSKQFQLALFGELVSFKLTSSFMDTKGGSYLMEIRSNIEDQRAPLEESLQSKEMKIDEFVAVYNGLTEEFQQHLANTLPADQYRTLLEQEPGDVVVLGDPEIAREAFNFNGDPSSAM